MLGFRKKQEAAAVSVQTRPGQALPLPLGAGERELYRALRENVPVIDAAVCKLRRLIGEFTVTCRDGRAQEELERFLDGVQVNAAGTGIHEFLGIYLEELITYGTAVGEMVTAGGELQALYNAGLGNLDLESDGALGIKVSVLEAGGRRPCPYPELLLVSALRALWVSKIRPFFEGEVLDAEYRQVQEDPSAGKADAPRDVELERVVSIFKLLRSSGYTLKIIPGTPEENAPRFDFPAEQAHRPAA